MPQRTVGTEWTTHLLLPLTLAFLGSGAAAQSAGSFESRRDDIRRRYIAAHASGDTATKHALVRELEALEMAARAAEAAAGSTPSAPGAAPGATAVGTRPTSTATDHAGLGTTASTRPEGRFGEPSPLISLLAGAGSQAPVLRRGAIGPDVEALQDRLNQLGFDAGTPDGIFGRGTDRALRDFQSAMGLFPDGIAGPDVWKAVAETPTRPTPVAGSGGTSLTRLPYQPNASALARAGRSSVGQRIATRTALHAAEYRKASELTGVPAELIAAIHVNESGQGTYRPSTHGPESGYGLDDRYVTTSWGNRILARHGLGRWERGTDSSRSRLQSAVIAAEHLKRQAGYAGVTVDSDMTRGELAAAVTSYIQGIDAGKRANRNGRSWMFDTSDTNPHPLHPGGTSRVSGGRTIRVPASRKSGLLRWDTLVPLLRDQLGGS